MTDCSILMTVVVPCQEFIDDMTDEMWTSFCPHSFVAVHQDQSQTQCRESLNEHECVVLVDFAEYFSFTVHPIIT
jgi:hypothetical protein